MNDVTRKILKDDEGRKYMSEEFSKETEDSMKHVKYVNGKVVSSEELDSAMYKDMQNCAGRSIFRNEDNLDEEGNSLEETDNN